MQRPDFDRAEPGRRVTMVRSRWVAVFRPQSRLDASLEALPLGRLATRAGARPGAWRGALLCLALLVGALISTGCSCRRDREELARASLATPRGTVEAFAAYMRSGLHDLEYRCFSSDFVARNKLSYLTYAEAREELSRRQPWLELFASPTIVGDSERGEGRHDVDVRLGGRTHRVNLVREETFRISAADELLADDYTDFRARLKLVERPEGGAELVARLPLAAADIDLEAATSVVLQRLWKIDGVAPLDTPN